MNITVEGTFNRRFREHTDVKLYEMMGALEIGSRSSPAAWTTGLLYNNVSKSKSSFKLLPRVVSR
jgi:hypothetical protein